MAFLLDTNVVSETVRSQPAIRVLSWLSAQRADDLFLAVVTLGELIRGARRLKDTRRRRTYERWIENDLTTQFEGRILTFDQRAAIIWGEIMGDGDRTGRPQPAADAQIAAIARRHNLTLATRNVRDFKAMDVALLDPWSSSDAPGQA